MAESLKQIFEGHTDRINHATELLKVLGDREGQYVWKQLTTEGGDFVAFVTADDENSYPEDGELEGYYYKRFDIATLIAENIREGVDIWGVIGVMKEGVSGVDFGELTLSGSHEGALTVNHNLGVAPTKAFIFMRKANVGVGSQGNYAMGADSTGSYQNYSFSADSDWLYRKKATHTMGKNSVKFNVHTTYWSYGTYDWIVIA